jgi:hypothetical protein
MRVHPYTHASFLKGYEISDFEYSDRLLLPKSLFEGFECKAGKTTLLSITNSIGQSVTGTVYGAHENQYIIYVPSWMYYSIDLTDNVVCSLLEQCICSKMTIRPHHDKFIETKDWTIQLGKALERYTSITEGSIIPLCIEGIVQKFTIVVLYPYKHKTCILQNGDVLDINILKSLELVKQEPTLKYLYKKEVSNILAFSCVGYKLGGNIIPENSTLRGVLLNAVKNRNNLVQTAPIVSKDSSRLELIITPDVIVPKDPSHPEITITPDVTVDTINKFFAAAAQLRKERTIRITTSA